MAGTMQETAPSVSQTSSPLRSANHIPHDRSNALVGFRNLNDKTKPIPMNQGSGGGGGGRTWKGIHRKFLFMS